jgi:hypothetical protein
MFTNFGEDFETPFIMDMFIPEENKEFFINPEEQKEEKLTIEEGLEKLRDGKEFKKLLDIEYWKNLSKGLELNFNEINQKDEEKEDQKEDEKVIKNDLLEKGFFSSTPITNEKEILEKIILTIHNLKENGIPGT